MESVKYVGLDVHQSTISVAVINGQGQLLMTSVVATKASAIMELLGGLRGTLHVTFEEGTHSAWLYDVLVRRVGRVVVCNPRKNVLLKSGSKSDQIDARKLAELLRGDLLSPVYHGESSTRALQQLVRSYTALTEDTTRVMARLKAVYRSQAIACAGKKLYAARRRAEWLGKLQEPGLQRRAERLFEELDLLQRLRRQARHDVMAESQKHAAVQWLRTVPFLGPLRAAVLVARVQTPYRFRTKRQFWSYCGLALETRSSADYRFEDGELVRRERACWVRGLNWNHNHELKNVFKSAATTASAIDGPLREFYQRRVDSGIAPELARLTLARKIAAIALVLWKKGVAFEAKQLTMQAA
ncbi:MAG TPA: transposase [Terriglobales bacterium]|nr:transposase [Terriglobales bacterium]